MIRPRPTILAVLLLCFLFPLAAAAAPTDTLEVNGNAFVETAPDQATLTIGVKSQTPGAQETAQENAKVMNQVMTALKSWRRTDDQIQTLGYRLTPRYDREAGDQNPAPTAYEATNQVRLTTSRLEELGELITRLIQAGANLIGGPDFGLKDPGAAHRAALSQAYAQAQAQAAALAEAAGRKLGRLMKANASWSSPVVPAAMRPRMAAGAQAMAPVPMEPGLVRVEAQVRTVFALEPAP